MKSPNRRFVVSVGAVAAVLSLVAGGPASAALVGYRIQAQTGQAFVAASADIFPAGADDETTVLSTTLKGSHHLPFGLTIYGTTYRRVVVSSNGNLQFTSGPGSASFFNDCLPSGNFSYPVVAPFWDDIVLAPINTTVPGEGVFVATRGVAPHRTFIINWRGHHFSDGTPIRAGVIFTEGSTSFKFQYLQSDAADATIGVQRSSTQPATQWACNQGTSVFPGLALTFVRG